MSKKKAAQCQRNQSWSGLTLSLKISAATITLFLFYLLYLDAVIQKRMNGPIWQLPAEIYARGATVSPHSSPNSAGHYNAILHLLKGLNYQPITKPAQPLRAGEFRRTPQRIDLVRRAFNGFEGDKGSLRIALHFEQQRLVRIHNLQTQRDLAMLHLEPKLITVLPSTCKEQRLFIAREAFPELLIDILLLTEDRAFYRHDGLSLTGLGRALSANLRAGRIVQGGSTLTQQLVKSLFLTQQRSLWRKLREAIMALLMDYRYSKDRILEIYLNEVYLGQNGAQQIHGFPLASRYYFGRPLDELTLDQQALLVALAKGPFYYNPWRHAARALQRRNRVLHALLQFHLIDAAHYALLSQRPLAFQAVGSRLTPHADFMQWITQRVSATTGDTQRYLAGAKIFTTLDPAAQSAAEKAVINGIAALEKRHHLTDLQAAMVVVDRFNGEIYALVGNARPQLPGFNRAVQARRPIGSLAKPPVYLTALSHANGYHFKSWLADQPLSIRTANGQLWQPRNFDRQFRGRVQLIDALVGSLNIPTINLGLQLGLDKVCATWQRLGVAQKLIQPVPALLLGAIDLTPLEVAQVYQTIASGGRQAELTALDGIIDGQGHRHYQRRPQIQQVVPEQSCSLLLQALQQVMMRGAGQALERYAAYQLAGKTGTTNALRDSWFVGIDGREVVVTWVGHDDNTPAQLTGAQGAMALYQRYLAQRTPTPLRFNKRHQNKDAHTALSPKIVAKN